MKWFKHYSDANRNAAIQIIKEKLGFSGVGRLFTLMELIADKMKPENDYQPILEITEKELKSNLGVYGFKLSLILDVFQFNLNLNYTKVENKFIFNYPKMLELKDNSSKTLLSSGKRKVNIDKEKEKEKEKEIKKDTLSFDFEKIWNLYPNRKGKKAALRHFQSSVVSAHDYDNIFIALNNYKASASVAKGFIQNGSTWFNNWKDYLETENEGCMNKTLILRNEDE